MMFIILEVSIQLEITLLFFPLIFILECNLI